jgi:hypothetical protein
MQRQAAAAEDFARRLEGAYGSPVRTHLCTHARTFFVYLLFISCWVSPALDCLLACSLACRGKGDGARVCAPVLVVVIYCLCSRLGAFRALCP